MADFVDAQAMAWQHPETFDAPEPHILAALQPGDNVKVCAAGERFWVILGTIQGETLHGRVNNDVMFNEHGLRLGDAVTIEMRHVYQVSKATGIGSFRVP